MRTVRTGDSSGLAELAGVQMAGRSERYTVIVTKDGSEILRDEVRPAYDEDEPNGPGCGICAQGDALIEVP